MDGTSNTAVTAQDHHGGGFKNVIAGLEHFPEYIIAALKNTDSFASRIVGSGPVQALVAYETTHGAEQLTAIERAGLNVYDSDRAKGVDKGTAILAGTRAAFECGVAEVKSLPTEAMEILLSAKAL